MYVCMYIEHTPNNNNTMADAMRWESERASEEMELATYLLTSFCATIALAKPIKNPAMSFHLQASVEWSVKIQSYLSC